MEKNAQLTKKYGTIVNKQKISPIHKFKLRIEQILGSNELNGHFHFLTMPTQISLK